MADGDEESEEDGEVSFKKPLELFEQKKIVRICAPMVRYSKLPFRTLVRRYGCDLAYTPMIVSDSFVKSVKARDMEFTTNAGDRPLIVQFAANNAKDFADAAEIVAPFSDGVDLNCGCPQRIVSQTSMYYNPFFTSSLVFLIQESVLIPVVANGDIKTESDVINVHEKTGVGGVMAARGILNNPAMFAGYQSTPLQCVTDWVDVALSLGTPFTNFHHHLIYMLEKVTTKADRRVFSELKSIPSVLEYLRVNYNI
ncbi:tRNA-dihydrouridine(20a/20b) synthase [NAD(P)+]-like [Pocillopora damicornis]|uniref:tRNA-dihydrouridine(20a/20b) synthase [NAD(P)+]-like n=1 Tax=Pocillopora damicornis TaxID=46731 RepID=UPI000F55714C|nr:tRNA-dihydrouridine(20a/20b) synthase [NAD(P)+]-like [Pocillopora damicornis]